VLAGGKRVTISIQASEREHALITTNPVERAEHPMVMPEQIGISPLNTALQTSQAPLDCAVSLQKTVPLHLLQMQEDDADTVKIRTNQHRQPTHHTIA
jgi:hypothetical protein